MEDYNNNTRIVFDYNLKHCIMNIPVDLIEQLKTFDYVSLQDTQMKLREYFVFHQNEFNIAGRLTLSYECCPDFYALISAVIADLSMCETWNNVYDQFVSSLKQDETLFDASYNNFKLCDYGDNYNEKEKIICMCSHLCCPENMSIITNRYTGLNALIACDCLEKTGIINSYHFKKKVKKNDCYSKIIVKKELEKQKLKNKIYKWEKMVSQCLEKNTTHRKCAECGVLSILKNEPLWKKKCYNCYCNPQTGVCLLKTKTRTRNNY
jgi:hypothetical protein